MANEFETTLLSMASKPAETAKGARAAGPRLTVNRFRLMRLTQRAGVILLIAVLSYASFLVITHYVVRSVKVVGVSMVPTLEENSKYLLNFWAFHRREPRRNDIVVIRDPGDHGLSVKRIVAVEGESILFKDGRVFVNGRQLDEPYLIGNVRTYTYSQAKEQMITCGLGEFFVLGDNRTQSIDSRSYGPVSREDILGLVNAKRKLPL